MAIVCTIDESGITAPTLADVRSYLVEKYQGIYGSDVVLDPDTQDGELIDLFAAAIHDANAMAVSVYGAFSPSTAQGNGLSRVVKINGISRLLPTYSTADLLIGGTAGTVITSGQARDEAGVLWSLPEIVVIPAEGQITVTATATTVGAVAASSGAIGIIATPTRGWQTVTNPAAATPGDPVEIDAALRRRQARSTQLPSQSLLDGVVGAVAALTGVSRYHAVENDTDVTDANGLPPHSFSVVADGGDVAEIAGVIFAKKGPGIRTYGTTSSDVTDTIGIPHTISFMRPTAVPISVGVTISALAGYTTNVGDMIKSAVAEWVSALAIGEPVYLGRLYGPANLTGANAQTFEITGITLARDGGALTGASIVVAYNEAASCSADNVTVTVA